MPGVCRTYVCYVLFFLLLTYLCACFRADNVRECGDSSASSHLHGLSDPVCGQWSADTGHLVAIQGTTHNLRSGPPH